jgi:hypothetical protein
LGVDGWESAAGLRGGRWADVDGNGASPIAAWSPPEAAAGKGRAAPVMGAARSSGLAAAAGWRSVLRRGFPAAPPRPSPRPRHAAWPTPPPAVALLRASPCSSGASPVVVTGYGLGSGRISPTVGRILADRALRPSRRGGGCRARIWPRKANTGWSGFA